MSLQVDDSASGWVFSTPQNASLSMQDAGWNQLADDPLADANEYFNSTLLWTKTPGATASFIFQGTDVYLYSAKSPQGGQMFITCDWDSTVVPLNQSELQPGEMVWYASGLDPTVQHALRVQLEGEGSINIDKLGIDPGPPTAIPPATPDPLPPAFPGINAIVSKSSTLPATTATSTSIVTMTTSASPSPSSTVSSSPGISLSGGALAGIVVGPIVSFLLIGMCFLVCWRRRRRRQRGQSEESGLRRLRLLGLRGRRGSTNSHRIGPSFMQIEDREKAEEYMEEEKAPGGLSAILPSIKRLSTLTLGRSEISQSPTPSRNLLAQFPQPPSHQSHVHHRNRSLALSLSINTDVGSVRENIYVGTVRSSRAGSLSRGETIRSVRAHRHTLGGFSASDRTREEVDLESDVGKDGAEPDSSALFYAEHFGSQSDHHHYYPDGRRQGDYVDEPDDVSPDTPLLPNSPAVASSNASLSYHSSSALGHSSARMSKGNKILRSLYSRSSERSSLRRQSAGNKKPSRRSSVARTPDTTRTPVSKSSHSSSSGGGGGGGAWYTSDSPRSERRTRTLSMLSMPVLAADSPALSQQSVVPPMPMPMPLVPQNAKLSPPSAVPPSAWSESLVSSASRRATSQLLRTLKPTGPRAQSFSDSTSTGSKASSSSDSTSTSTHSRTSSSSQNERGEVLSVVEEASGSGSISISIRTSAESVDRNRGSDFFYD